MIDYVKRSEEVLKVIIMVLNAYGCRETEPTPKTIAHWTAMFLDAGEWDKVVRYKLTAYYASQHGQPLPKSPLTHVRDNADCLLGGGPGRWLRKRLRDEDRESLLQSLKQCKKGMPRQEEKDYLLGKANDLLVKLITPEPRPEPEEILKGPGSWARITEIATRVEVTLTRDTVKQQIVRTVRELFPPDRPQMSYADRIRQAFPSTSANYYKTRREGGALAAVMDKDDNLLDGLRTPGGCTVVARDQDYESTSPLWKESRAFPKGIPALEVLEPVAEEGANLEEEHRESGEEEKKKTDQRKGRIIVDTTELERRYEILWWRMLRRSLTESREIEPVALPEALKTRVITKGPPIHQTVLRGHWHFLHQRLRQHKVFQLLGAPETEQYVLQQLGYHLEPHEYYLSGDYEAATDNIRSWVTDLAAEAVGEAVGWGVTESALVRGVLTQHLIPITEDVQHEVFFRTGLKLQVGTYLQETGQLMGSRMSFPFLCIINAAMSRWALEIAQGAKIALRDARLMVNGDDVAMRGPSGLYEAWRRITSYVGLKESVGKTYFSRSFVDINSRSFRRSDTDKKLQFEREDGTKYTRLTRLHAVPFVNMGLVLGLKRSGTRIGLSDQDDPRNNVGTRCRELLTMAAPEQHPIIMKVFLNKHREVLTASGLPWFIPEWLGGLGLPPGPWGQASQLDLRIAARILRAWKHERPISLAHQSNKWKTWAVAEKTLPEPTFARTKGPDTEFYATAVAQRCVDLIFDSTFALEDLMDFEQGFNAAKAIGKNAELWRPLHRPGQRKAKKVKDEASLVKANLPPPLHPDAVKFQAMYPTWQRDEPPPSASEWDEKILRHKQEVLD
jgi:hypothetical protein